MESLRKISLQLVLSLFAIFPASSSDLDYALDLLANGKVSSGIIKLEKLAFRGNEDASYSLGILYLAGKNFPTDLKKSYFWLRRGADNCHSRSIEILKTYFYEKRGSRFFDPLKYEKTLRGCQKETELQKPGRNKGFFEETTQQSSNKKFLQQWEARPPEKKYYDGVVKGQGSALAINKFGDFLTNEHVINGCDFVLVQYWGFFTPAEIGPVDKDKDLAIIRSRLPTPYFWTVNGNPLLMGDQVFSIGYPSVVVERNRVTQGTVNIEPVFIRGLVLTKSQIPHQDQVNFESAAGASGSSVFDANASFRGVLTALALKTDENGPSNMTWAYISSPSATIDFLNEFRIDYVQKENVRALNTTDLAKYGSNRAGFVVCGGY